MRQSLLKNIILPGIIGNTLEWFEFFLYGYFAPILAPLFFPSENYLLSLLQVFGVFAAGFLMRPFGGILFGYVGDRIGRQKTLTLSILLMAIPTTCMGLLPTYQHIGMLAGILLLLCRLLQGVATGGEKQGAAVYVTEHAQSNQRGWFGSWTKCGIFLGILLASSVALILGHVLSPVSLTQWGWRLPFLAGIPLGILGYYLRSSLPETPPFQHLVSQQNILNNPLKHVLIIHWRVTLIAIMLPISFETNFYLIFIFIPTQLKKITQLSFEQTLLANSISLLILTALTPLVGKLSDYWGRKSLLMFGAIGGVVFAYPLFVLLNQAHSVNNILLIQMGLMFFMVPFTAVTPALFSELFPTQIRYTASSLASNLAATLFGGTAPLVATYLISRTGNLNAPAWYMIITGVITLLAIFMIRESRGQGDPLF